MSTPPLSDQLDATARAVAAVAAGRSLTDALALTPARLRPGAQALSFHALRHLGAARAVQARLTERAPSAHTQALMQVALTLLWPGGADPAAPDKTIPHYDAHTVVNQAVDALRSGPASARRQTALLNACLRRFLRERDALVAQAHQTDEGRWNHPAWWVQRLQRDHPAGWTAVLAASQAHAPMVLRVNRRRTDPERLMQTFASEGIEARRVGLDGLRLERPLPVERLPGFREGLWSVQDSAAQRAAPLLLGEGDHALPAGARVLDACAAPGGKTAHLLERASLDVWALDIDGQRCQRIHDNLARLGLGAHVVCADAAQPATWWDGRPFDAILLDAPCTASGIVRRHPDVRWLRRPGDVAQLATQQRTLLDALWPLLAPGGRLLYATCSVFRAEGEDQAQAFLKRHTQARRGPAPGHLLPGVPAPDGVLLDNADSEHDGFYYALFHKPR